MENLKTFERFNQGVLALPKEKILLNDVEWSKHPKFEGVELKHIVTAKDTGGQFSYHLVKIAPNKSIWNHVHDNQIETHEVISGMGSCINDGVEIKYEPGVITILQRGIPHEVNAGEHGLYMFAKFMPALC